MRTTLTLEEDVAIKLQDLQQTRKTPFKEIVNEVLRLGLQQVESPGPRRKRFKTRTVSLGNCLVGSIDDVAEALAIAEREHFQ